MKWLNMLFCAAFMCIWRSVSRFYCTFSFDASTAVGIVTRVVLWLHLRLTQWNKRMLQKETVSKGSHVIDPTASLPATQRLVTL